MEAARTGVEGFLTEVNTNPEALVRLNHPEAFAMYDRQLRTLEQNVLRSTGIDQQTAAYQLDLIGRARQMAAMARANSVAGAVPMDALVNRLNTADGSDPLVQQAWTAIGANPDNRELLATLQRQFPEQPRGFMGAIQGLWTNMSGTERVLALGGTALAVAGLISAFTGGGMTSALMGGGGLLALLSGLGGGSLSGIGPGFQRLIGLISGRGAGPTRTPLALPEGEIPQLEGGAVPPPAAAPTGPAAGPATTPAPAGVPAPTAPAAFPSTPEQFKARIAEHLASGNTARAVSMTVAMFRTIPQGMDYYRQLDGAFNNAFASDNMIASRSGGMLTPPEVAQLRRNWPAVRAQMGA